MSYNEERMIAEAEAIAEASEEDYRQNPDLPDDDADTYDRWRDNCCDMLHDDIIKFKKDLLFHLSQGYLKNRVAVVKQEVIDMLNEVEKEVTKTCSKQ